MVPVSRLRRYGKLSFSYLREQLSLVSVLPHKAKRSFELPWSVVQATIDIPLKKASAREVFLMVPVSRLRRYGKLSFSYLREQLSLVSVLPHKAKRSFELPWSVVQATIDIPLKKASAREVFLMVPVSRLELPTHALRMRCSTN